MEQEKTLEKTIDLTGTINKYKSVLTKQEEMPGRKNMIQAYNKATLVNKKLEELTDRIRTENTTFVEKVKYDVQTIVGKLKLGQMSEKKTIEEYLEPVFEKMENLSQNIYDCTAESLSKYNSLNSEIKVIMQERDSCRKDADLAFKDYELIETEIVKLKEKGVSVNLKENKGSDLDVIVLRDMLFAGKNALSQTNNKLNNYEIRAQEYDVTALFADIMNEIVMSGKQSYDDVNVMVRTFRRGFSTPMKVGEMATYMVELDKQVRYMSKYMFDVTKITSNLSGLLVGLRINDGSILPGAKDAIRNDYNSNKSELEAIQKEADMTKERLFNLFPQG